MNPFVSAVLSVLGVLACLLVVAPSASADIIDFTVDIEWTAGDLDGTTSTGYGTFDDSDLTGSGFESVNPVNDDLTFDITIDGEMFDETSDIQYSAYPLLMFEDGDAVSFDFLVDGSSSSASDYLQTWSNTYGILAYFDWMGTYAEGNVTVTLGGSTQAPEPTTLALMGLGTLGLIARRRRRRVA